KLRDKTSRDFDDVMRLVNLTDAKRFPFENGDLEIATVVDSQSRDLGYFEVNEWKRTFFDLQREPRITNLWLGNSARFIKNVRFGADGEKAPSAGVDPKDVRTFLNELTV